MTATRVLVTGLGATSPVGGDVTSTWSALLSGQSGVDTLKHDWAEQLGTQIGGEVAVEPTDVALEVGAGSGYITTRLDAFSGIGRIPNLAVTPAARGAGTGSALIRHALDYLREQGMAMAKIETLVQNERGQALYPRFGFREVARQIHYVMPLGRQR